MFTLYLIMDKIRGNNIARHFSKDYPNYTINFIISKDLPAKNAFSDFATNAGSTRPEILAICDSDAAISHAKKANLPVIALSHEDNPNESLLGTSWLILTPDALNPDFLNEVYCRHYHLPLTVAKTDRCLLRELTLADLPSLLLLQKENTGNPAGCFFPEKLFCKSSLSLSSSESILENFSEKKDSGEADFLEAYIKNQYSFYSYGIYGIFHRDTEEFMGIAGFYPAKDASLEKQKEMDASANSRNPENPADPAGSTNRESTAVLAALTNQENPVTEVGYSILKKWQGKKIASEALPALLIYGRDRHSFSQIFARIRRENTASICLARKNGIEIIWED